MDCNCNAFPPKVVEITSHCDPALFYKTTIPAALGDDRTVPPQKGAYRNMVVVYEANNHVYLYSSDGMFTLISTDAIHDYVIAINGKDGVVTLTAKDIKALPADTVIPKRTSQLLNDVPFVNNKLFTEEAMDKQNTLVAGENIIIRGNVISADMSGLKYDDTEIRNMVTENTSNNNETASLIKEESAKRFSGDAGLSASLDDEKLARSNADVVLNNKIAAETKARRNADEAILQDKASVIVTTEDPGPNSPLSNNTFIGVYE